MAAHLEANQEARAVVNFAPVLLEQIETYLIQIERWRHGAGKIGDPLLAALVAEELPETGTPAFLGLIEKSLRANRGGSSIVTPPTHIWRNWPSFTARNRNFKIHLGPFAVPIFLVWYHLGWMGRPFAGKPLHSEPAKRSQLLDG